MLAFDETSHRTRPHRGRIASRAPLWGFVRWSLDGSLEEYRNPDTGLTVNAITPAGRVRTGFWNTEENRSDLPPQTRDNVQDPGVMNDAMVLLTTQGSDSVTDKSMSAPEREDHLG